MKGVLDQEYAYERKRKKEYIFRYKVRAAWVKKCIENYAQKNKALQILDFGSAEGLTLLELNKYFPDCYFTGIEYSRDLMDMAPNLPLNVKLVQGDITKLKENIRKIKYDVIIALAVLEHLEEPDKALREAFSVLKPGGLFLATAPNPVWDHLATRLNLLNDHHQVSLTKALLHQLITDAGLIYLDFKRFMWAPVSVLPYFNVNISPHTSLKIDEYMGDLKFMNWLCVNQMIIAQKSTS